MLSLQHTRRDFLRSSVGLAGLTLPTFLKAQAASIPRRRKAKACIVIYTWGGMSHYESFDPKPEAPVDIRGEFKPIKTATPGVQFCEHIPLIAKHSNKLAIVRSVHHNDGAHSGAVYLNLTGHRPEGQIKAKGRKNWPSITSVISHFHRPIAGVPGAVRMPYSMYDNGRQMAGEGAGWLGGKYDPILMRTPAGEPYGGVSRFDDPALHLKLNLEKERISDRLTLLEQLDQSLGQRLGDSTAYEKLDYYRQMAADMLLGSPVREAYDLETEDQRIRDMYGDHIGGQSLMLARRLIEAGVPITQVVCSAGDLNGGKGDMWDTHSDNFNRLKNNLLPVWDQGCSALLNDLEDRGMLDETLVVFLTEFGRTPKINGSAGRDHYPNVYSVALAGGGIQGGHVYGSSDTNGAYPRNNPCTPADLHATIFNALGIHHNSEIFDPLGRPLAVCEGEPLPLL